MPERVPSNWWRRTKFCLRAMRLLILLVLLLLVTVAFAYLSEVGLPGFLKQPLVEALHARGFNLQFSSIRWRWDRGLVAENVRFGSATPEVDIPQLTLREVALHLNHDALLKLRD